DWGRAAKVVPAGLVGTIPGALLVLWLPPAVLAITVSLLVIAGLLFTILSRSLQVPNSLWVGAGGGFASGLMNVTAGVGGPGLVGLIGGNVLARWVHGARALRWVIVIAMVGALISLVQGLVQL